MSESCLYCRIASSQTRPFFVLENERLFAMPALHPINPGHLILLPRGHFEQLDAVPAELAGELMSVGATLGRIVADQQGASGYTLTVHQGSPGQAVPHVHLHVIPRHELDDLDLPKPEEAARWDLVSLASQLRERLGLPQAEQMIRSEWSDTE